MRVLVIRKRTLLIAAMVAAIIIAATVILLVLLGGKSASPAMRIQPVEEYELNVLAGKQRELPVYSVECSDKKIALTVDAAWEADKTEFILDTLKKHEIKATFFLCGVWVNAYPNQVKAIAAAGHEIGNHSLTHPHMNKLDAAGVQKEISQLDDRIETLTGKRCTLFRAPFGEYNDTVIQAVRELGYEPIQWNLDTIDWKQERSSEIILNSVLPKLSGGSIILCHNNGYEIKNYLPTLIEKAMEQGYSFVKVSELLLPGETMIDSNGMQKSKAPAA
ncbi:MAG: polysaccharide deacetylase family protein [Clostridia bacterium]